MPPIRFRKQKTPIRRYGSKAGSRAARVAGATLGFIGGNTQGAYLGYHWAKKMYNKKYPQKTPVSFPKGSVHNPYKVNRGKDDFLYKVPTGSVGMVPGPQLPWHPDKVPYKSAPPYVSYGSRFKGVLGRYGSRTGVKKGPLKRYKRKRK